jgi:hypothetical protein
MNDQHLRAMNDNIDTSTLCPRTPLVHVLPSSMRFLRPRAPFTGALTSLF